MSTDLNLLQELADFSNHYGKDPDYVLAGGGNSSVKSGGVIYIKGSGTELATIKPGQFVALDRAKVDATLTKKYSADPFKREEEIKNDLLAARVDPASGGRPSVESALHELFQTTFVLHLHPWPINSILCAKDGEKVIADLFGDSAIFLPYCDPGYTLAKNVEKVVGNYRKAHKGADPDYLFIQNHGPFVTANSPKELHAKMDRLFKAVRGYLDKHAPKPLGKINAIQSNRNELIQHLGPAIRALLGEERTLKIVPFDDSNLTLEFVATAEGKRIMMSGPMTPDQVVYCKSLPMWVPCKDGDDPAKVSERLMKALAEFRAKRGYDPKVIAVEGLGFFSVGDSLKSARTVHDVYVEAMKIMKHTHAAGGPKFLTPRQYIFLDEWEVENYRRQVAALSGNACGRAQNKVALVTGGAQGFGREIAEDLARQGAYVILADVNVDGANAAAKALCDELGSACAIGMATNVTDPESLKQAAVSVVRAFGGLDILVSNAGVLRADSVKTQVEKDFDFMTNVNYRGYYVCVKYLCPLMATQHAYNPAYTSDIIQINSKSGLVGSYKNFGYVASKFGGIGMTQSFALELIEDGIKVNSICPGNFLDGPLWSDPKNGLFVQYLRLGKVPGAKTIADVRKVYEAKVPMKRGCTTADVMHAVYYLIDQQYETGQAVPVTGGQNMLK